MDISHVDNQEDVASLLMLLPVFHELKAIMKKLIFTFTSDPLKRSVTLKSVRSWELGKDLDLFQIGEFKKTRH